LALVAAVALLVIAFVAAGSATPAVATVDGQNITLPTFQDWLKAAAVSAHSSDSEVPAFVPDAPSYSRCVAFEQKALSKGSSKAPSVTTLRTDCGELRATLAEEVMQFLLGGEWFLDQGAREHLSVSAAQVQRAMHSSFPKATGLTEFLNDNGLSRSDLEYEARAALMAQQLSARHSGPTPTISASEISSYYNSNRSEMGNDTLEQATPAIRAALIEAAQAPTFDAWMSTVQKYFQPRTVCAAGYRIAYYCRAH